MHDDAPLRPPSRWSRSDSLLVAALIVASVALRLWHLTHTVVIARDTIHYSRVAWRLGHSAVTDWPQIFRESEQHPGYPISVWLTYVPVRVLVDGAEPYRMQLAAQFASSIASVLLVIPVFLIGRRLWDRRVGFGAALLMQCLPVSGRLFGDGLSEALFLLLTSTSLLFAMRAVQLPRALGSMTAAGAFSALAYWVRPEGAVVVAATGLVLLASQFVRPHRRSWSHFLQNGVALAAPAVLIALPFVLSVKHFTAKPMGQMILNHDNLPSEPLNSERASLDASENATSGTIVWAVWWRADRDPSSRSIWAAKVLFLELLEAGVYVAGIPALLAWWTWLRQRRWPTPAEWLMIVICLLILVALWNVAVVGGYLSSRHGILIVLCCSFSTVAGSMRMMESAARHVKKPITENSAWALAPALLFCACVLPKTLKPLHKDRAGFREAGEWLAQNTHPTDPITDPYRWSQFYAGRLTSDPTPSSVPPNHRTKEYVVIEIAGNPHRRLRHLPPIIQRVEARPDRERVFHRKVPRGGKQADLIIYALPKHTP